MSAPTPSELGWLRDQFERCRPWIQAALDRDIGTHTIDDVWDEIESGKSQLWPMPNSVIVSSVETYPRAKVLQLWLAGGDLSEILAAEPVITAWAARNDCASQRIIGRYGWIKFFPDATMTHAVITRRISNVE